MPTRIREEGGISILDIEGKIDINSSEIIEAVGWLVNSGKLNILINLENVDMVDYSGLSILAIAYKNAINHKGKLKLLSVPLSVVELLKVAKLEAVFETYSDEKSAIASFFNTGTMVHLRRKFQRLDIHIKVNYKLLGSEKNPKIFEGTVLNLSAAGIYIHTKYVFPLNSLLELSLGIPGETKKLTADGRIVYLADKEIQPHVYPGMGVALTHLEPKKERAIIDFIDRNVTHRADEL
ncbi:MAG: PilZ domain-containing protein [Candidatus Omnitrophica bacterium]|nr:PilZ domain-containing protein [Candidatus Omnitrophota bacterium]